MKLFTINHKTLKGIFLASQNHPQPLEEKALYRLEMVAEMDGLLARKVTKEEEEKQ